MHGNLPLGIPIISLTQIYVYKEWGAVDGSPKDLSSVRGELQGQTAMAIISNLLLRAHNKLDIRTTLLGENKGIQHKCANNTNIHLHNHQESNVDLL